VSTALPTFDPGLVAMVRGCALAARLTRHVQTSPAGPERIIKPDFSPVTIADLCGQALINREMARSLGAAAMVNIAEESSEILSLPEHAPALKRAVEVLRSSGVWPDATPDELLGWIDHGAVPAKRLNDGEEPEAFFTADPIDGTRGFIARRQYSVCAARIEHHQPVYSVVSCPALSARFDDGFEPPSAVGTMYFAQAGLGTWMLPDAAGTLETHACIRVQRAAIDADHPPSITFSVEPSERRVEKFERLQRELGQTRAPAQLDSQAKYAVVARGQADVYFRPPRGKGCDENVWDHAPGILLCREAGCVDSDLDGRSLEFRGARVAGAKGVLSAPPMMHARVLAALGRMRTENQGRG
jgi:3'(2'), 5'-bisphosphate nucleotidase